MCRAFFRTFGWWGGMLFISMTAAAGFFHRSGPPEGWDLREHVGIIGDFISPRFRCAYRQLGVRWLRMDFRWDRIEPAPGRFDWTVPDRIVAAARDLNAQLMINLWGTPAWANGGQGPNVPPDDPRTWTRFVAEVVRRYRREPGGVHHWLIWNEPNLTKFFTGTMFAYVYDILIPAARVIHTLDPMARVGAPEMTHHWTWEPLRWNLVYILQVAAQHIDIVTQHTLAEPAMIRDVIDAQIYPILAWKGWIGRPFWITEVGWDHCGAICAQDAQAHKVAFMVQFLRERAQWLQMVVFFSVGMVGTCSHDWLAPDFTCPGGHVYPAFLTFYRLLQGQPFVDPNPACHRTQIPCVFVPRQSFSLYREKCMGR